MCFSVVNHSVASVLEASSDAGEFFCVKPEELSYGKKIRDSLFPWWLMIELFLFMTLVSRDAVYSDLVSLLTLCVFSHLPLYFSDCESREVLTLLCQGTVKVIPVFLPLCLTPFLLCLCTLPLVQEPSSERSHRAKKKTLLSGKDPDIVNGGFCTKAWKTSKLHLVILYSWHVVISLWFKWSHCKQVYPF